MTANPFAAMLRDAIVSGMRIANETPIEQVPAAIDAAVLAALSAAVPADLAEAGKVLEGVTPGPWNFTKAAASGDRGIYANGTGIFVEAFADIRRAGENNYSEAVANARFIAWCREGVPALIALATAQAAQIAGLEKERDEAEQRGYANAMDAERKLHEAALAAEKARVAKLVEALEFYASWDSWVVDEREVSAVSQDEGKTARAATEEVKK